MAMDHGLWTMGYRPWTNKNLWTVDGGLWTKCCLTILLLGFITSQVWGHQISIRGIVYDQGSKAPLPGATVRLLPTPLVATTDQRGIYTFADLPEGKYEIRISFLGYAHSQFPVEVSPKAPAEVVTHLKAGSLELAEVAVSASQQQPLQQISAVDLQLRPVQRSQEMLRLIPGLFITQHAGGGKAEQILLRGFDMDHGTDINLSVDGMPVNMVSHAHGQGYADLHFLIPETIQQVDFGKGPYRADKGNFATAGYAAFTTRRALDKNLLKLEGGSFGTFRGLGLVNLLSQRARQNQQQAYWASEYLLSRGYFDAPQHLHRLNLMGQYQGVFRQHTILHASLAAFRSSWDASGQIPRRAVAAGLIGRFGAIAPGEGGQTARYHLNMTLEKSLHDKAWLRQQAYVIRYDFELYSNFTFFLHDPVNGDQIRQRERRHLYGYQGTYHRESALLGHPLRSELGLGLRYDHIDDSELSRTKDRRTTLAGIKMGNIREVNAFGYLQQTWELSPELNLKAGVRLDQLFFHYQSRLAAGAGPARAARLSPKLTITYTTSPRLQLFASSGMGYHSNDSRLAVTRSRESLPAARGLDAGLSFKPADRLLLHAALWWLDLDQELVYVGDEGVVETSGATRRYGVDLSLRAQLKDFLFADTDLNLARPRYREAENDAAYVPLAPALTSTGGLSYRRPEGLKASLRYRLLGARPANETYSLRAEGHWLLDAVVAYTWKGLEFKLTGENLLNSPWQEAQFETLSRLKGEAQPVPEIHFTPGTPFSVRAGVAYSF